jgi:hypothetical protein
MQYLKQVRKEAQVFLTTHSTNFLDTSDMRNVYLVSKTPSTHIQLLDLESAQAEIPRELGIRLSSLFMFDRLVFVEGPTDEAILRELASKLNINLSLGNLGFVSMGGVRNFANFSTEKTLAFLKKRQVKMWFILDRDERDESEITKLQEKVGDNAYVRVLRKREIENYLLSPKAILEFIKMKLEAAKDRDRADSIHIEKVRQQLNECAEELRPLVVDKRVAKLTCNPIYPDRKILFDKNHQSSIQERVSKEFIRMRAELDALEKQLDYIHSDETQKIAKDWEAQKLAIVPGDLLLDLVCQKFGVRFKKEQNDSIRLAEFMTREDIDQDMKTLLNELNN